ncbi:prepilin peptidase [Skermania sp. ID1734]|uniref:prepilin peptidase n=1 Tax=Skermania sp. ID1734 TaxID=2597516 RepID=UPI0011810095|nr:A24 family peptidase [Skermania sp. ID1734]TSD94636.1 prepilin peptidase [Skermania sp. ID1734]
MAAMAVAVWCVWLSVIDMRERRLPNALTIPGALAVLGYAVVTGRARQAVVGGLVLAASYLVIHLARPSALGAGDVKLALGVGALAALGGAQAWVFAALLAPCLTALVGATQLIRRRSHVVAHGPSMCAATLLALCLY